MSLDVMKQALAALEQYTNVVTSAHDPNSWVTVADGGKPARDAITALRAAIEHAEHPQTVPAESGLAEKVPARGTSLEPVVRKAFDYIYAEQDPRRWENQETCHCDSPSWCKHYNKCNRKMLGLPPAPRQWQGLTPREVELLDGMIEVQLRHAAQCDGIANRTMAEKQKSWDMERVELLRKLKSAHGNKGTSHD